jgi:serine/threonine protein kinase
MMGDLMHIFPLFFLRFSSIDLKRSPYKKPASNIMLSDFVIDLSDYEEGRYLGEGQFNRVFEGIDKKTGTLVAIRQVKVAYLDPDNDMNSSMRQLHILAENEHPGTLRLRGFRLVQGEDRRLTIITDLMENGTLSAILKGERQGAGHFTPTRRSLAVFGITAAMAYCHSRGILHRDLKPEHILMTADFEPVVAGFSLAEHYSPLR